MSNRIERVPQHFGVGWRSAATLEFANPPELFLGCIRHQQIGKNFSKRSGVPTPAEFNHFRHRTRLLLHALIDAFRGSAKQVAVIQNKAADPLGVARGEGDGDDASLTQSNEREAPKACSVHNGFEIANPRVQGKIVDAAI